MSTELEQKYSQYIHKSEIAFLDETCQQRGVFATEDMSYGDVILKIPLSECFQGTHIDLTYRLMDMNNVYSRSLPAFVTNFPVMWTPSQVESLDGSAMKDMIQSRKQSLLDEDVKKRGGLFLRSRLMVGSRGFTLDKDLVTMVPYADMLNHSSHPNIDWKITDDHVILSTIKEIKKGDECAHSYGTKTNYEHLLFYGMCVGPGNKPHDITYELFDVPTRLRSNLNYNYFKNTIEFELCGSYSRGTREIFSFVRFLVCKNAKPDDCPKSLQGLYVDPISRSNELMTVKVLMGSFIDIYNGKIKKLKDATHPKVAEFAQTELDVLVHWIELLKGSQLLLEKKSRKAAMKILHKMDASVYGNQVLRKLILDNRSYIKEKK